MAGASAVTVQEVLVRRGLVSREEIGRVSSQVRAGEWFVDRVVAEGLVAEEQVARALADELAYPYVALTLDQVDAELVRRAPPDLLRRVRALPLIDVGSVMDVAFADPSDQGVVGKIETAFNREVRPAIATSGSIRAALREVFGNETVVAGVDAHDKAWEASGTLRLYSSLLECVRSESDDLLLVPTREGGSIRLRKGGRVHVKEDLAASDFEAVLARLRSLVAEPAGSQGFRRAVVPTVIGGRSLRLTVGITPSVEGPAGCVHLEPALAGRDAMGELVGEAAETLRASLAQGEGLMVVNDDRPERAGEVVSGLLEGQQGHTQCVAVVSGAWTLVDGALHLTSASYPRGLEEAVEAALALEPDVLVVQPPPGDLPPRRALLAAGRGRRVLLLASWATASETVLALRAAGLPPGAVESRLRWILVLGRGDRRAVLASIRPKDAVRLASARTPSELGDALHRCCETV